MTKVRLDGASVAFSGKIKGYTKSSLQAHLRAQGASVSNSPNGNLELFLVGDRAAYKKVDKARALGLTIIEGDALYTLLETGEVELEEAPVRALDELIADARALFDGAPSREVWEAVCALADECEDAHIEDFVAYLMPQLDAWPRIVSYARQGYHWEVGPFTDGAGEARLMPSAWLTSMLTGAQHPKHRLATAISFSVAAVNSTISAALFDNPDLSHIRTLDIGSNLDQNVKKKGFYKKMASTPYLAQLDTLMLSKAPAGAFAELAKATSLPNLERILTRRYLERMGADFEAAVFGPWAAQLECVGVIESEHLKSLVDRMDELPSLTTLALGTAPRTEHALFEAFADIIGPLLDQLKVVELGLSTMDDGANEGLGVLLDALDTDLEVLDMRPSAMVTLEGPMGITFVQKHIIDNGLGARVGELRVGSNVSREVCDVLTAAGIALSSPWDSSPGGDEEAAAFEFIEELAPGEEERVAANHVHVHDAMMFSHPNEKAWATLTSVVDGLELQLDDAAFAEAIDTLEAHLEQWPDYIRECPDRWLGELLAEEPSPKIRLVRAILVYVSYQDPKATSRFWSAVAEAGNISHIEIVRFSGNSGKQKFYLNMLEKLFLAARPSSNNRYWSDAPFAALAQKLADEGVDVAPMIDASWSPRSRTSDPDGLKMREVTFKVSTPEELQRVFDMTDMDHVVSLDIKFDLYFNPTEVAPGWSELTSKPATWRNLRHLCLETLGALPAAAHAPLVNWLSQARPVQIDDSFSSMSPYHTSVGAMIQAGMFARTFGSSIELPTRFDQAEAEAWFGQGNCHVSGIRIMYGGYSVPDTLDLVDAMHSSLRACLKSLKWPTTPTELTQIDELLSGLPALSIWTPICPALRTHDGRAPMLAALAASPASAQLALLRTVGAYAEQPKVKAAELKVLEKGVGMRPAAWIMLQN